MGIVFVNGRYIDENEAFVSIEDRGFQFGDGVYEVIRCYDGKPFAVEEHLKRLTRSTSEIRISLPYSEAEIQALVSKMVEESGLKEATVYIQVTRGYAKRRHWFPDNANPTFVMYVREFKPMSDEVCGTGIKAIIVPDLRWLRCDIKSVNLLPNVMARQEAEEKGATEALFEREGIGVVEGTASNLFLAKGGTLVTAPLSNLTLPGITRDYVLKLADKLEIPVEFRFFSRAELMSADEVFVTSTTKDIVGVTTIDEKQIGSGVPGPITKKLYEEFKELVTRA